MPMQEIRVAIDSKGNASVQVVGGQGPACTELTAGLIEKLAATPNDTTVELCEEYHTVGGQMRYGEAPRMISFGSDPAQEGGPNDG